MGDQAQEQEQQRNPSAQTTPGTARATLPAANTDKARRDASPAQTAGLTSEEVRAKVRSGDMYISVDTEGLLSAEAIRAEKVRLNEVLDCLTKEGCKIEGRVSLDGDLKSSDYDRLLKLAQKHMILDDNGNLVITTEENDKRALRNDGKAGLRTDRAVDQLLTKHEVRRFEVAQLDFDVFKEKSGGRWQQAHYETVVTSAATNERQKKFQPSEAPARQVAELIGTEVGVAEGAAKKKDEDTFAKQHPELMLNSRRVVSATMANPLMTAFTLPYVSSLFSGKK